MGKPERAVGKAGRACSLNTGSDVILNFSILAAHAAVLRDDACITLGTTAAAMHSAVARLRRLSRRREMQGSQALEPPDWQVAAHLLLQVAEASRLPVRPAGQAPLHAVCRHLAVPAGNPLPPRRSQAQGSLPCSQPRGSRQLLQAGRRRFRRLPPLQRSVLRRAIGLLLSCSGVERLLASLPRSNLLLCCLRRRRHGALLLQPVRRALHAGRQAAGVRRHVHQRLLPAAARAALATGQHVQHGILDGGAGVGAKPGVSGRRIAGGGPGQRIHPGEGYILQGVPWATQLATNFSEFLLDLLLFFMVELLLFLLVEST